MKTIDYLIIGAGIAGLGAAYELKKYGKDVLVLEEKSYPGGRMSTVKIAGATCDLGAQFILPIYRNIWQYAKELNLKPVPIPLGKLSIFRNGRFSKLNTENAFSLLKFNGLSMTAKIRLALYIIITLKKAKKINFSSLDSYFAIKDKSLYEDMIRITGREVFDYFFDPLIRSISYYSPKEFSHILFLSFFPKLLRSRLYSFENGINKLSLSLAKKLKINYNSKVLSVKRAKQNVLVEILNTKTKQKLTYTAKKVIYAIPGNKILDSLKNPNKTERRFFSKISYSSMARIYCYADASFFKNFTGIWLPFKENNHFTGIGKNHYIKDPNSKFITFSIRESFLKKLKKENKLNFSYLSKIITKDFPEIKNLEIIDLYIWENAVFKCAPGYFKHLHKFKQTIKPPDQILFCGDYMESFSTEGALTSGIATSKILT